MPVRDLQGVFISKGMEEAWRGKTMEWSAERKEKHRAALAAAKRAAKGMERKAGQ